jgi:Ni/Fe-hydrogenase subunit HybB-like protein
MSQPAQPVGGPLLTRSFKVLLALGGLAILLVAWRFAVGLGASTGLSDGYPWGLWIAFDVVTGTALASGGYAIALLVYIFNKGRYHPLVRPAILTSALGYTMAGLAIAIDVGRPWHLWKVPLFFWEWNLNSVLLEVALCVMAYVLVLWIELSPAFLDGLKESRNEKVRRTARAVLPRLDRILLWVIALGILLPTMHQSSLGSLMLIAGPKLHPLWNTPLLPLLFLISTLAMGYAIVVFESALATTFFRRRPETAMLSVLGRVAAWTMLAYVVVRMVDLIARGRLEAMLRLDLRSGLFWLEIVLALAPLALMLGARGRHDLGRLFQGALFMALAGGLYRFDTYLVAYDPGPGWHYFPTVPELFITLGIVALEVAIYIALVKRFPILGGARRPAPAPAH